MDDAALSNAEAACRSRGECERFDGKGIVMEEVNCREAEEKAAGGEYYYATLERARVQGPVPRGLEGVDPRECALLVIDVLGDPVGGPFEDKLLTPTLNAARIAQAARENDIPVIFANDAHLRGIDRELELWGEHGIAGTPEAQTSPQMAQQESDYVVEKRRYSAFFQTSLCLLLNELGAKTLICVGMDTNICVRHTVADAYFNNYGIVIVDDATATFLIGQQEEGLEYMKACYAATVISTEEALAFMAG